MSEILNVLSNNILPIFLVAGVGFALRRLTALDKQTVSRLTFYVFSPALLFDLLVNSTIEAGELGQILLFAFVAISSMGVIGWVIGRVLNLGRQHTIFLILVAMFGNVGNMGLPLNELRYGAEGLARAAPFLVVSGMLSYTVGVILASLGTQPWQKAVCSLTKLPILYAIIAAISVTIFDLSVPTPLNSAITIAGRGAVPVMLIVLGMQMADVRDFADIRLALPAISLRLVVAPLVAIGLLGLFGLDGLTRSVGVIEMGTPVAVATIIITTEYNLMPQAMTTAVVLSTLLSPLTLVALIQIFGL